MLSIERIAPRQQRCQAAQITARQPVVAEPKTTQPVHLVMAPVRTPMLLFERIDVLQRIGGVLRRHHAKVANRSAEIRSFCFRHLAASPRVRNVYQQGEKMLDLFVGVRRTDKGSSKLRCAIPAVFFRIRIDVFVPPGA
jgi:hypothetical protein